MFRAIFILACCWALSTAGPMPQQPADGFGTDAQGAGPQVPSFGDFLQTLTTVTDLLNRFTRSFTGVASPGEYNEFEDVETAKPRVSLIEETDQSGAAVYKVTIVRPADSAPKFARQVESTTAPPAPTSSAPPAPSASPSPVAPVTQAPPPAPAPPAPPAPPPATPSPQNLAAEIERTLQRRISEIAFQLEQEEARMEFEQDKREQEAEARQIQLENANRQAQTDFELQQQAQERELELEERRRELALERAALDREAQLLGPSSAPLTVDPAAPAAIESAPAAAEAMDQAPSAAGTITRIYNPYDSRESEEALLRALRRQNIHVQAVPRKTLPLVTVQGRPIRTYYDSPEISLEDRLRYGGNPRLVQISAGGPGSKPVYRFADSDEILYRALQESAAQAAPPAQSEKAVVKQSLVAAPVAAKPVVVVESAAEGGVKTNIEPQQPQSYRTRSPPAQRQQQPVRYTNTRHEMFEDEGSDELDESALSPIMFLLKNPTGAASIMAERFESLNQRGPQQQQRESLESMEDINRSGNRLDNEQEDELTDFEREWHYHPQPHSMAEDVRVNKIFRTRNVDYYNPDAEAFHHLPSTGRYSQPASSIAQPNPIK